jgi:SAM-dependent methyltransferase
MSFKQTIKEIIRGVLSALGLHDTLRKFRGRNLSHLQKESVEDRFTDIYTSRYWTMGKEDEPVSGPGSSIAVTGTLRRELPGLLAKIAADKVLDVGCGDFVWMKEIDLGGVEYIGVDLVAPLIEENTRLYGKDGVSFHYGNAISDPLPAADVILAREILFHLSFADIAALLENVLKEPRKWLLITSDSGSLINTDIRTGDWRPLNLQAAPFKLPEPIHRIDESSSRPGRNLCAWTAEQVRTALGLTPQ